MIFFQFESKSEEYLSKTCLPYEQFRETMGIMQLSVNLQQGLQGEEPFLVQH